MGGKDVLQLITLGSFVYTGGSASSLYYGRPPVLRVPQRNGALCTAAQQQTRTGALQNVWIVGNVHISKYMHR